MADVLCSQLHIPVEEAPLGHHRGSFGRASSAEEMLSQVLNAPEYSTDEFRMFHFKVERCTKRCVHDWRACPFAHPTENARRRDPRLVQYLPVPCPEYKRGICLRGDACTFAHGVYECWLHPAKYRTQLCKEGPACRRPVCFFAHALPDLRQPTHVPCFDGCGTTPTAVPGVPHSRGAAAPGVGRPVDGELGAAGSGSVSPTRAKPVAESRGSPAVGPVGATTAPAAAGTPPHATPVGRVQAATTRSPLVAGPATPEPGTRFASPLPATPGSQSGGAGEPDSTPRSGRGASLGLEGPNAPRMSNAVARKLGLVPQRGGRDAGGRGAACFQGPAGVTAAALGHKAGAGVGSGAPAPLLRGASLPVLPTQGRRTGQYAETGARPAPGTIPASYVAAGAASLQQQQAAAAAAAAAFGGLHPALLSLMTGGGLAQSPAPFSVDQGSARSASFDAADGAGRAPGTARLSQARLSLSSTGSVEEDAALAALISGLSAAGLGGMEPEEGAATNARCTPPNPWAGAGTATHQLPVQLHAGWSAAPAGTPLYPRGASQPHSPFAAQLYPAASGGWDAAPAPGGPRVADLWAPGLTCFGDMPCLPPDHAVSGVNEPAFIEAGRHTSL